MAGDYKMEQIECRYELADTAGMVQPQLSDIPGKMEYYWIVAFGRTEGISSLINSAEK